MSGHLMKRYNINSSKNSKYSNIITFENTKKG